MTRYPRPEILTPGCPDLVNVSNIDRGVIPFTRACVNNGMCLNREHLWELSKYLDIEIARLGGEITEHIPQSMLDEFTQASLAIDDFNIDSPDQIATLLFRHLRVGQGVELEMTPTGDRISTGKKQLERIKKDHAVIPLILQRREYTKLQNTYCVAPGTRILTADLRWVAADSLSVGDSLFAFDEYSVGKSGQWRKWRRSKVLSHHKIKRPCYELLFDDGTKVTCSEDHKWLARKASWKGPLCWVRTDELLRKDNETEWAVAKALPVWGERTDYDAGYLSASFDSEGYVVRPSTWGRFGHRATYTQKKGGTLNKVLGILDKEGFRYVNKRKRAGDDCMDVSIGHSWEVLRLLGEFRPERLLKKFFKARRFSTINLANTVRVVKSTYLGLRTVVSMKTSTGTFLAEGLASHNCDTLPNEAIYVPSIDRWKFYYNIGLTFTSTGRMTVSRVHQIPIRTELGRKIRQAFEPEPGMVFISADYAGLELRILAHCAVERKMIEIFSDPKGDIHQNTVDGMNMPDTLDATQKRLAAKRLNFAVVYGSTDLGLWLTLQSDGVPCTREQCAAFQVGLFVTYPDMAPFIAKQHHRGRRYGFDWNIFGRVTPTPEFRSVHKRIVREGERRVQNWSIQSTATDVFKIGAAEVYDFCLEVQDGLFGKPMRCEPLLPFHDQILLQVEKSIAIECAEAIGQIMAGCVQLRIPLKVDHPIQEGHWKK